jgi:MFS family permease
MNMSLSAQKSRRLKLYVPLIVFSFIIFLISLHDGIMSYMAPVIIEERLNNTFLVGAVLSISALFGMFLNFVIAQFFALKDYTFFMGGTLLFALGLPLAFLLLPRELAPFILAMVIWSVYYELRNYSKYDFVHRFLPTEKNTLAWSVMTVFQSTSYMLGPAITVFLVNKHINLPLYASLIITSVTIFVFFLFVSFYKKGEKDEKSNKTELKPKSFWKELSVLKVLTKRIWVLVIFSFTITLLDVTFWTTGVLYAEQLRVQSRWGSLFLILYCLPTIFIGWIIPHLYQTLGKKRTALIAGIGAGVALIFLGLSSNIFTILGLVVLVSIGYDVATILICATFEDYITRLDTTKQDLVSINQLSGNLAYTVGPILMGFISYKLGFGASFLFAGVLIIISAIFALAVVPRKIKMPHMELAKVLEEKEEEFLNKLFKKKGHGSN